MRSRPFRLFFFILPPPALPFFPYRGTESRAMKPNPWCFPFGSPLHCPSRNPITPPTHFFCRAVFYLCPPDNGPSLTRRELKYISYLLRGPFMHMSPNNEPSLTWRGPPIRLYPLRGSLCLFLP